MSDLIDRQAAIDDIETVNPSIPLSVNWVKNWVKTLPSAQPVDKDINVPINDTISRQMAIDSIRRIKANYCETADDQILLIDKAMAMTELMILPSAQPEGIYYFNLPDEDYEKIAEQIRKTPIVLTFSEPEIVRCAECKWFQCNMRFDGHLPKGVDEFECRHWCGFCDPTDFCSYAERRINE